jgi:hypothetical protein
MNLSSALLLIVASVTVVSAFQAAVVPRRNCWIPSSQGSISRLHASEKLKEVGSISSDGKVTLTDKKKKTGSLGVSKKSKHGKPTPSAKTKMSTKDRQRTGNGAVDSSRQTRIADPENESIEVLEAKRGNKAVTIIR